MVRGGADRVTVRGLSAALTIDRPEGADALRLEALAGDDVLEASGLQGGILKYAADGGAGADVLIGSAGDDELTGGDGDDVLVGRGGTDVLDGGAGDNVVLP